jgi:hypothetical protein
MEQNIVSLSEAIRVLKISRPLKEAVDCGIITVAETRGNCKFIDIAAINPKILKILKMPKIMHEPFLSRMGNEKNRGQ